MRVTCLKTAIHVPETHLEARVSQNFYIGLRLNLIACRSMGISKNSKNYENITKVTSFLLYNKDLYRNQNSETPFSRRGCFLYILRVGMCRSHIK